MTTSANATGSSDRRESVLTKFVHPFIVVRDAIRKKFVLRKKRKPGEKDPRVVRKAPRPRPEGSVLLSTSEKKFKHCTGSQNLWYECEDRLCNKYWLNDATGEKVTKKPKAASIIQLMIPKDEYMFEKRVLYLRTRPNADYATEVRQLLILSENESIQRIRAEATNIGARQLENAEIHSLDDLLNLVGMIAWKEKFESEGIDLSTAFFMKDENLSELGLGLGERIRLMQVLECMRKIEVVKRGGDTAAAAQVRTTKFIKGDIVEHLKESENLIRRGKIVGVHADDIAAGVYYTVALENEGGYEVQSAERKLEFPGVWERVLREKGIEPIFKEPGGDDDQNNQALVQEEEEHVHEEQAVEEQMDEVADEEPTEDGGEVETGEEYSGRGAPPPLPPQEDQSAEEQSLMPDEAAMPSSHGEEMPMFVGMSRYSRRQSVAPPSMDAASIAAEAAAAAEEEEEDDRIRKQSVVSLLPMVDTEELVMEDDETSGMTVPPPAIPAPRRRSSAASKGSAGQAHRESVFSLLPTTEVMELDDDENESSGMAAPPPPVPHRSDSVWSETPLEGLEEVSVASYHPEEYIDGEEDNEHSGMPPPPPIPSSRRSSNSSRKDSVTRRDSNSRRVSFTSATAHSPHLLVNARRPSSAGSAGGNDTSSVRMEEELSAMGEVEPMEMHEEEIDLDDDA